MNGLLVGDEKVGDEDAATFYNLLSAVIEQPLNPEIDKIAITKPDRPSRSAGSHMLLCRINDDRFVALKRCADNHEFMRREIAVDAAKRALGLPRYNVVQVNGVRLRNAEAMKSCSLVKGWEQKTMLVVDFGKYRFAKNLHELTVKDIVDMKVFCYIYGYWAAFNYILTVRDRNAANFILFTDSQLLHSIDNEEGPLESDGADGGVLDIVFQSRQNIERFVAGANREEYIRYLRKGFREGFDKISKQSRKLDMFHPGEISLIQQRIQGAPSSLEKAIFT